MSDTTQSSVTVTLTYRLTDDFRKAQAERGNLLDAEREVLAEVPIDEALRRRWATLDDSYGAVHLANKVKIWQYREGENYASPYESDRIRESAEVLEIARRLDDECLAVKKRRAEERSERCRLEMEETARYKADRQAREEREEAERAARIAVARDQVPAWIAAHGSTRLKLSMEAGVLEMCKGVYLDERINAVLSETAGESEGVRKLWGRSRDAVTWHDALNPSEKLMSALMVWSKIEVPDGMKIEDLSLSKCVVEGSEEETYQAVTCVVSVLWIDGKYYTRDMELAP